MAPGILLVSRHPLALLPGCFDIMHVQWQDSENNVDEYECEFGCGMYAFDKKEVEKHELVCEWRHTPGKDPQIATEVYECEHGCGFESLNAALVEEHEGTCELRDAPQDGVQEEQEGEEEQKEEYECEYECGFEDTDLATVEEHELRCKFRPPEGEQKVSVGLGLGDYPLTSHSTFYSRVGQMLYLVMVNHTIAEYASFPRPRFGHYVW